jgi:hypothetical protein
MSETTVSRGILTWESYQPRHASLVRKLQFESVCPSERHKMELNPLQWCHCEVVPVGGD